MTCGQTPTILQDIIRYVLLSYVARAIFLLLKCILATVLNYMTCKSATLLIYRQPIFSFKLADSMSYGQNFVKQGLG